MSKRTTTAEFQIPFRQDNVRVGDIPMPPSCSRAIAMLLGEGLTDKDRLRSGVRKYRLLRQCLLDRQVRHMATRFRFKDVTPKEDDGSAPKTAL